MRELQAVIPELKPRFISGAPRASDYETDSVATVPVGLVGPAPHLSTHSAVSSASLSVPQLSDIRVASLEAQFAALQMQMNALAYSPGTVSSLQAGTASSLGESLQ